jgi:hypothetical protein
VLIYYQHARREAEKLAAASLSAGQSASPHLRLAQAAASEFMVARGTSWMTRYNELVNYKREFGDCHVPNQYKANPLLGNWVQNQRSFFKTKSLSEDRIAKLKQNGFTWEVQGEKQGRIWMA